MHEWSAQEAAVFLRFVYSPEGAGLTANLLAVRQHLPAVLEMAHKLDAPKLLSKLLASLPGGRAVQAQWKAHLSGVV